MAGGMDIEMRWILLWEEMYEALERDPQLKIVDEAWQLISRETFEGLFQDVVYEGHRPRLARTWYRAGLSWSCRGSHGRKRQR